MKSLTLIVSIILVLSISNIAAAPHNNTKENPQKQHTFLVKTDLTKEQVELLLNQYHQNKNQHRNQGEITNLKNQAPEVPEPPEPPEAPEMPEVENENETEAVSFKKKGNKKKEKNEKNEVSEGPKTQEVSEVPEVPEVENKNETEKIGLKKTGIEKEKEKIKRIGMPQTPDSSETTDGNNDRTITIHLKKKGNDKKEKTEKTEKPQINESSEVTENETEKDTVILVNKNNAKQSGSRIIEFISVIILTIAFVSFFIYVTQPKKTDKKNKNKNSFNELAYYLKVKGN